MHGIGNDFIVFDNVSAPLPVHNRVQVATAMCDRRFGIGADGTIYIERTPTGGFAMRMFNPDGSESEMCGNGVRCVAKYLRDSGLSKQGLIPIDTGAGLLTLEIADSGEVRVDMGRARLLRAEIGVLGNPNEPFISQEIECGSEIYVGTAVSMGNPHLVIFVPDVSVVNLESVGPQLERHSLFAQRINVHFVEVVDRSRIIQRTWERGAGITLACGTGACACVVAASVNDLTDNDVEVTLPGGKLTINYRVDGTVFMTGPAVSVFDGVWKLD